MRASRYSYNQALYRVTWDARSSTFSSACVHSHCDPITNATDVFAAVQRATASFERCSGEYLLTDVVNECFDAVDSRTEPAIMVPSTSENETSAANEILVPNPYELIGHAHYQVQEAMRASGLQFASRRNVVFFRGVLKDMCAGRVKSAHYISHRIAQTSPYLLNHTLEPQPKATFAQYKYLLDIGGSDGTTWDALRWKMAIGSLVFRVASGRHTYFGRMVVPWVHYVPVAEDLHNLSDAHAWATRNPHEANKIANAGQHIAIETSSRSYSCLALAYAMERAQVCSKPLANPCVGAGSELDWRSRTLRR